MDQSQPVKIDDDTKAIMVRMVSTLLSRKPTDPVPHIYSFLLEAKKGVPVKEIEPITENELNELSNPPNGSNSPNGTRFLLSIFSPVLKLTIELYILSSPV